MSPIQQPLEDRQAENPGPGSRTEIEQLRRKVRELEERVRALDEAVPVMVWSSGPAMEYTHFNPLWLEFTGRTLEQELGDGWTEDIHRADLNRCQEIYAIAFQARRPLRMEYRLRRHDGEYRWVLHTGAPRYSASNHFDGYSGSCIDIHDQKMADRRLQAVVEASSKEVWRAGSLLLPAASLWEKITGEPPSKDQARWLKPVHPQDRERVAATWRHALATGSRYDIQYRVRGRGGSYRTIAVRGVPICSDDGEVMEWVGTYTEVSDRQRADESARRWKMLIEHAHFGVVASDPATNRIVAVNAASLPLFGYPPEELVGKSLLDIMMPDSWMNAYGQGTAGEEDFHHVFETTCMHKNGAQFPALVDVTSVPDYEAGEARQVCYVQDLSEQKQYQAELEMLYQTMPIGVCLLDHDLRFLRINNMLAEISGIAAAAAIGCPIGEVAPWIADEIEIRCRHVLDSGEPIFHAEVRRARPDEPHVMRDWLISFFPIKDTAGVAQSINFVIVEITDLKRAQRELQDNADRLRVHNEDLKQFAYAAGHDLQEPLRMVVTFTQLLAERNKDKLDADANYFIENAVQGALRIRNLLDGLREYWKVSERDDQPRVPAPLGVAVQQALGNLRLAISESGAEVTYPPGLPTIYAHPVPLIQLFQNLIVNAIRYRSPGRRPEIRISAERQGLQWLASVTDNGIGIDARYREQIFKIFKRLHGLRYPGAGIGLALCQRIVERYGGRIWVESEVGVGSTFRFTLPAGE